MDLVYTLIGLFIVFSIGYLSEENKSYFMTIAFFLIPLGILMGHFLEEMHIYTLLFLLGILMERTYMTYKWPVSKKPKTADYRRVTDWLMKIIFTLMIIFSIEITSGTNIFINFTLFFGGMVVSNVLKKFDRRKSNGF